MAGALAIGFSTHGIGVFDVKGDAGGRTTASDSLRDFSMA